MQSTESSVSVASDPCSVKLGSQNATRVLFPSCHSAPSRIEDLTRMLNDLVEFEGMDAGDILPLVYEELRRHASRSMGWRNQDPTMQPTALVHEAWLRLTKPGGSEKWNSRAHFFGAASRAMRRIMVEDIRRKKAIKRGGDQVRVDLEETQLAAPDPEDSILLIEEALQELEKTDPRKSSIVVLKFFGGHSNAEVAEALEMSVRSVERYWAYAKAWLMQYIEEQQSGAPEPW